MTLNLNIQKDAYKIENQILRKFYLELEKIKKSTPEKKVVLKQVKDDSTFFKRLFGNKEIIEKTVYTESNVDGYISLNQFINLIYDYFDFMYLKSEEFIKSFKEKTGIKKDLYVCFGDEYLSSFLNSYSEKRFELKSYCNYGDEVILDISFGKFPRLINGINEDYEKVKRDFFLLVPYFRNYFNICQSLSNIVNVSQNSNIMISNLVNDIFKRKYPKIKFSISDVALIEVTKEVGESIKYTPYADDIELVEMLEKYSEELFYSCYISNDLEIVRLLMDAKN